MTEECGERLNPFEAALRRPEVFIGSIETEKRDVLIMGDTHAEIKNITYNGGLYSIIREIGSNSIDNKWKDVPLRLIKISMDTDGCITFWNDGKCIPVEKATYSYTDHRTQEETFEDFILQKCFLGI